MTNSGPNILACTATDEFANRRSAASRAAVVANRVVAQTFQIFVAAYASPAKRQSRNGQGRNCGVLRPRGNLRVVDREVVIRFEPNIRETKQKDVLNQYGLETGSTIFSIRIS